MERIRGSLPITSAPRGSSGTRRRLVLRVALLHLLVAGLLLGQPGGLVEEAYAATCDVGDGRIAIEGDFRDNPDNSGEIERCQNGYWVPETNTDQFGNPPCSLLNKSNYWFRRNNVTLRCNGSIWDGPAPAFDQP